MNPILFIGESWLGSNARSFKEALARQKIAVEEIQEEHYFPILKLLSSRIYQRIFYKELTNNFEDAIIKKIKSSRIKVVIIYKGAFISKTYICRLKKMGCKVINVFPDTSPIAHGPTLANAMSWYDIVYSTKCWHPANWQTLFGFTNKCIFIPHGYDPLLHILGSLPSKPEYDVVLVATYRPEYFDLVKSLSLNESIRKLKFKISGSGWHRMAKHLPENWEICPPVQGYSYCNSIKEGKICLAPLTTGIIINSVKYPGDQDSARTYELPALGSFYIHLRTPYVQTIFDESTEVPMYDNIDELSEKIVRFAKDEKSRIRMADAAHRRAVPRDSLDNRAGIFIQSLYDNQILS